ncbi:hypothetical protein A3860_34220 [Niastella vici]|uniref:Tyr recombinase domain-containing protein n=1 Tax=Niastella vici TaxID=1703345 RepID=A0A1V9FP79_9BACT|nr:phage integrase SAM-like domain-containing protein [Niastella vici]OQP60138.1 hypothetical protein A3860_34220 [Niastella vici]
MRQPIKLIIKKGNVHKDETSPIFVQYCYSTQKRVLLSTDINIPAKYWNKKTCSILTSLPTQYGDPKRLEADLRAKLRRAEQIVDYAFQDANTNPIRFLKRYFKEGDDQYLHHVDYDNNIKDVFYQMDLYIESKTGLVKDATLSTLRQMKRHVQAFQRYKKKKFTFDSFGLDFYQKFVKYLTYDIPVLRRNKPTKGLRINTIGKTIKHFKSFLKDRMARKIIPYTDLSFFKYMEEEVDAVYLDWNELSTIYHLDLSRKPYLIKYRDLLVLACLTGFRFGDFTNLNASILRNGLLHVCQEKTGGTVIAPLHADAQKILIDQYNLKLPRVSEANFNFYIKEVVRLAGITQPVSITHKKGNTVEEEIRPKFAWVSSHIGRRSFCTNEYLAGTPADLIMTVSGHKSEKAFRRYIKADQLQKATLIKKLWDNRPGL